MAPRPRNTTPPVPPTTQESPFSKRLSTTTTTTVPSIKTTPTTTVPAPVTQSPFSSRLSGTAVVPGTAGVRTGVVPPTPIGRTPDVLEASKALREQTKEAIKARVPRETVREIVTGQKPEVPGGWRGALANVINFDILGKIPGTDIDLPGSFKPVEQTIIKPLTTIDIGRRALVSGFRESVEFARQLKDGQQVYTARDYIPVHPQTQQPIAKIGDPVIANVNKVLNTPIPGIEKITTVEQAKAATDKLVKDVATTTSGSFKDLVRQTRDVTTGFGDIPYLQTGNKWVDRAIGFFGDVALDPTTYLLGPGALAKGTVEAAGRAGVKRTALELAEAAAKDAADNAARIAADAAATAAEKAAAQAAKETADIAVQRAAKELTATEKLVTQAQRQAPRRVYGAGARESLANTVRGIREEAIAAAADASLPVIERTAAAQAVSVLKDELIADIATKGYSVIKGEAARLLGVRPGLRIGLPGLAKYTIAITAPFTDIVGKAVAGRRLWFVNTPKGAALLNKFMGAPEGGILGDADILAMRTALSRGTVKGPEAVDYVALLAADNIYRGQVNLLRKDGVAIMRNLVKENPNFKSIARKITPYLETPETEWATRGLKALNVEERAVYDAIREITDKTFDQADAAARKFGGTGLTKLEAYFPRVQSAATLQWAARNRKAADKLASELGIDTMTLLTGNYLDRTLVPGKKWFGYELKAADIAGGVARLNEIARQYGKLKFDFFTADTGEALAQYLNNHARYMAYMTTVARLPDSAAVPIGGYTSRGIPSFFDVRYVPEDIINKIVAGRGSELPFTKAARIARETKDLPALRDALTSVETKITSLMRPDKLVNWSPEQIQTVKNLIEELGLRLEGDVVVKREIATIVNELENHIVNVTKAIDAGTVDPAVGGLLLDEAENIAISLADSIGKAKTQFAGTPAERWAGASEIAKLGFESINPRQAPNLYVRREVASMLQNLSRLDDAKFARATELLFKDLTTFTKAYVTGSLGFHVRNAIGNTFMMIGAGGRPDNLLEGIGVFHKIQKGVKQGKPISEIIDALPKAEQAAVRDAIALSGATGFGQFGEIAQAAGVGRTGVTGRAATGLTPFAGRKVPFGGERVIPGVQVPALEKVSTTLFAPFRALRTGGAAVEEYTRFALLYDGIKQGLDPLEAANRVNKYLVDYSNINAIDRNVRSIVPFWMWMSRNLPLQVENMWMAPGAYQKYLSFRRNLQDKDGESPYLPEYLKEAGAFKIPGTKDFYLRPELGFPGAGAPNPLQQLAGGNLLEILSGLTPAIRIPLELESNTQFFSGAPILTGKESAAEADQKVRSYIISQGVSPLSVIGRYLTAIPGEEPKLIQQLTGAKLDRELQATLSLIGSPAFPVRPQQERNEIWRRYFQLQEEINKRKKERKSK